MKKFLKSLSLFILIGIVLGEIIVRSFDITTDITRAYIDKPNKLVRYYPNQTGNYIRGNHKWVVNKYGEYGYEPKSLNNLVTVIGDSFISNIMNPPECHQANYLSQLVPQYNFYPSSRDGATFLEMMQRAKTLEHLYPVYQLLYLSDEDFVESIIENKRIPTFIQLSLKQNKLIYYLPNHNDVNYNDIKYYLQYYFKFFYYIYRQNIPNNEPADGKKTKIAKRNNEYYERIEKLALFTKEKFKNNNIILVFRPNSDKKIIEILAKNGFQNIILKTDLPKDWELPTNRHWSCFGHQEVAKQVAANLLHK